MTLFDFKLFCSVTEKKKRLESICEDYQLESEHRESLQIKAKNKGRAISALWCCSRRNLWDC